MAAPYNVRPMKVYSVHLRRHGLEPDHDLVLVREGFNWAAFLLSFVWALWHRLWLVALAIVTVSLLMNLAIWALGMDALASSVLSLGVALLTGLLANDCRRWTLARQGFADYGVSTGETEELALARFLDATPALAKDLT